MKLNQIHHIAIICTDYYKSKDFYVRILGFEARNEVYRKERQSYKLNLALNGTYQIELFSFPNPPNRLSYPEAAGLRHLAFEVDDIEEAITYLTNHGVSVEGVRIDSETNNRFTFFCTLRMFNFAKGLKYKIN
ncbi:VOC family protein [Salipaludibacillus sp. HK11]|uniref:SMU1112c/YaeR family gloxylase I-like metalloprotein n=1 Tax=Salipaludibacillus sp. HK11 TaxID=3394320 RepID=UPI0039FCF314